MARQGENIGLHDLVEDVIGYLHQSHEYYLNNALVSLASAIGKIIEPCTAAQKAAVWQFFSDYKEELEGHFRFEENQVIPYVKQLIAGSRLWDFSIDSFHDNHSNIDAKLSDLRSIIDSSLPAGCDRKQRQSLMLFISGLQKDLARHISLEEDILVPMVRMLEDPSFVERPKRKTAEPVVHEPLSDREKEILVNVASGLINKEIADKLNISVNTVITHRKNITRKIGIKTVPGLTAYAILNGLVDINTIE